MIVLFWISAALIVYVYVGYLALLVIRKRLSAHGDSEPVTQESLPTVSVIISARNEAEKIAAKIHDLAAQDYPAELLEVLIVSDGSSDDTVAAAKQAAKAQNNLASESIRIIEFPENHGKPNALNEAVKQSSHEILVMADVRQRFSSNAIAALVDRLADPGVGCVSGELRFREEAGKEGATEIGAYWRYERFLRHLESETGSVMGMTGAIYAIRKDLYKAIPTDTLIDDVLIPMNAVREGFKAKFENSAIAYDVPSTTATQEWKRKVRTMGGNWQLLFCHPWLISPFHNPEFIAFFSHKAGRLLIPFLIAITLVTSFLIPGPFYTLAAWGQAAGIGIGIAGTVFPDLRNIRLIGLASFFLLLNAAVVAGLMSFLQGDVRKAWTDAHKDTHA